MHIQAIIFDCFGVLATGTWQEFVDTLPPDIDRQAIHDLNHAHDAGIIGVDDFLYRIRDLTGHEPKRIEDVKDTDIKKNQALLHYIDSLQATYKLGILSNIASDWVTSHLLTTEEQELFDEIVLSYQVGMAKPNPEIFRLTADRLGVALGACVFIDDMEDNVAAAKATGMHALQYRDLATLKTELQSLL